MIFIDGRNIATKDYVDMAVASISGNALQFPFLWSDAAISPIVVAMAGKIVLAVEMIIQVPFDTFSTLSVGDASDNSRLLSTTDNDTSVVCNCETEPAYLYTSDTQINLYISAGVGNTTGSGLILIYT